MNNINFNELYTKLNSRLSNSEKVRLQNMYSEGNYNGILSLMEPLLKNEKKEGRKQLPNELCNCGSKKKYKKCCKNIP